MRHLLTVWNPSYQDDAMEAHLRVLRDWSRRCKEANAIETVSPDDVYVWWGKVKSPNRQQPLANLQEILDLDRQEEDAELHLYLTDYRSLYVGELLEIRAGELPEWESQHVPAYYREKELSCDAWFMLGDIRRLVYDDMPGVIEELKKLRNVHYNDRPVSIYGGMVNLPLIVTRSNDASYFHPCDREAVTSHALWVDFDAEIGSSIATMERELRENRFGESLWYSLEPAARVFFATGERLFREYRHDSAFDFAPVLTSLAKAIEVQANAVLQRALARLPTPAQWARVDGRTVDLTEERVLSLGALGAVISGERELNEGLGRVLDDRGWFRGSLPAILLDLADERNAGAHTAVIDAATATHWRNRLVGVGCEGDLVTLAKVRLR
jgi:hypothetical protein